MPFLSFNFQFYLFYTVKEAFRCTMAAACSHLNSNHVSITFSKMRCHVPSPRFQQFARSSPSRYTRSNTTTCQALGKRTTVYETLTLLNVPATADEVSPRRSPPLFFKEYYSSLPWNQNTNKLLVYNRIPSLLLLMRSGLSNTKRRDRYVQVQVLLLL